VSAAKYSKSRATHPRRTVIVMVPHSDRGSAGKIERRVQVLQLVIVGDDYVSLALAGAIGPDVMSGGRCSQRAIKSGKTPPELCCMGDSPGDENKTR
jgi:hypothetical protein